MRWPGLLACLVALRWRGFCTGFLKASPPTPSVRLLPHTGAERSNDIGAHCLGVLYLALRIEYFDPEFSRDRLENIFDDDGLTTPSRTIRMAPLSYLTISKSE